jgi:phosphonate transport system substrate-binding protein
MDPRRLRRLCLALPALALYPAVGRAQAPKPSAAFEVGVLPNLNARLLMAQYQPLRDFLQRELGRPVQVSTAPGWSAFHQRVVARDYDLLVTAAHMGRLAQLEGGYRPLLSVTPDIKGLVITAPARPLRQIGDLRGQVLALSNPQSLVTLRGMRWLQEQGLHRGRDFQTIATPTDDSVGNVVLRGDALAAMCSGGEFKAIPDAVRSQLAIVTPFTEVPGFLYLVSPAASAAQAQALKELLLRFSQHADEGRAYFAATGFTSLRELPAGLMEALDPYVEPTRRLLAG